MTRNPSDEERWRRRLTPEQYRVTREGGTEPPFSGTWWRRPQEQGHYRCVCCGALLFDTGHQFEPGCGWPSFTSPAAPENLETREDLSHGMRRIEVRCHQCDAHLGHVFDDGPAPTGKRYCINSVSLQFERGE